MEYCMKDDTFNGAQDRIESLEQQTQLKKYITSERRKVKDRNGFLMELGCITLH